MIELFAYKPGDALLLNCLEREFNLKEQDQLAQRPYVLAYTAKIGEQVVAVFAMSTVFSGVFEVWSLLSQDVKKHPKTLAKTAKKFVDGLSKFGAHRIQMTTRHDLKGGQKWAEFLGFKPECVMRKYGPDQMDHILYSKVF